MGGHKKYLPKTMAQIYSASMQPPKLLMPRPRPRVIKKKITVPVAVQKNNRLYTEVSSGGDIGVGTPLPV